MYKIRKSTDSNVALHTHYVDEVKHLCIHAGNKESWWSRVNSSHPPLDARMNAIDPHFELRRKREFVTPVTVQVDDVGNGTTPIAKAKADRSASHDEVVQKTSYESTDSEGIEFDQNNISLGSAEAAENGIQLSDRGVLLMQDSTSSLAALFALFLPEDQERQSDFLSAVSFAYNHNFADAIKHIARSMSRELSVERVGVVHFATRQLRKKLNSDTSRRVLLNLERLIKSQGLHNLNNYAAVQHIRRELAADFPILKKTAGNETPDAEQRFLKPFDKMSDEFALLLSLVLESTELSESQLSSEYRRVLNCYTETDIPRRSGKDTGIVREVEAAFQQLLMQPRAIREAFVHHCIEISELDTAGLSDAKRSVVQLFSASLGCVVTAEDTASFATMAKVA